jgi:hypothetical protein
MVSLHHVSTSAVEMSVRSCCAQLTSSAHCSLNCLRQAVRQAVRLTVRLTVRQAGAVVERACTVTH